MSRRPLVRRHYDDVVAALNGIPIGPTWPYQAVTVASVNDALNLLSPSQRRAIRTQSTKLVRGRFLAVCTYTAWRVMYIVKVAGPMRYEPVLLGLNFNSANDAVRFATKLGNYMQAKGWL